MNIRDRLLALLNQPDYRPANEAQLARLLQVPKNQKRNLAAEIHNLLSTGRIGRVQGDRLKLTAADAKAEGGTIGRLQFRTGGSAFVILESEKPGTEPAIQIAPADTGVALHGDRVTVRIRHGVATRRPGEQAGRVIRVLSRERDTVVGNLVKSGRRWTVQPDDPRYVHAIAVEDPAKSPLKPRPAAGDKVIVRLAEWTDVRDELRGTITALLGRTHEPRAELLGIYERFNLSTEFPPEVEREVAGLPDRVLPREIVGRHDYRKIPTFTIDPDDAKDFDDALSIEELGGGEIRIGIHIADVSAYVKAGTTLDREAQRRGNSTYLVGTVIPMLPVKLSNGLCSLVEGEDRLTKAVLLTFGRNGRLKEKTFANTVIRSRKRLTYKQAYALLFEDDLAKVRALPLPPRHQTGSTGRALSSLSQAELAALQEWVRTLWRLGAVLRQERFAHGSLDLDMPETKVFVDEQGFADRLELIQYDESHQLIEEFMLAANEAVAHITKVRRMPSLYRVHDEPDPDKLDELRQLLKTHDIHTGHLSQRAEIVKLLKTLKAHPQGHTLRTELLRSLKKAAYRATPDGHYGLHKKDYTHFTSPIRRYADLVVHRVFDDYLVRHAGYPKRAEKAADYTLATLGSIGAHLSLTEINSQQAERDSVKIKLLEFFERELAKKQKTRFAAIVTDVRRHGLFIELVESMTFGFIGIGHLAGDHFAYDQRDHALVGRRRQNRFAVGTRLDVVVERVDRFKRTIDFRPAAS